MKVPNWFVIGCGLLVVNLVLVLGGTISRHAAAESPDDTKQSSKPAAVESASNISPDPDDVLPESAVAPVEEAKADVASVAPTLLSDTPVGPSFPSLDNQPQLLPSSEIVSLKEIENSANALQPPSTLLAPVEEFLKEAGLPVSEQLSHSYFESMKLRLQTVEHLNQSAIGLVEEASILYQRGEITQAQKLIGIATQLRETTARLLVSHQ